MADDPNKSEEPINGKSPASSDAESILKQFERVSAKKTVESEQIRQYGKRLRKQQQEARREYTQLKKEDAETYELIIQAMKIGDFQKRRDETGQRFLETRVRSNLSAQNTLVAKTASFVGPSRIRSRVNEAGSSTEMLGSALQQVYKSKDRGSLYFEQEKVKTAAEDKIATLSAELESIAASDKPDKKRYSKVAAEIGAEEHKMALAEKTMGILKKQGDDPASQAQEAEKYIQRYEKQERIKEGEINAGKKGYTQGDIDQQRAKLGKSLKELTENFDGTKKSLEKHQLEVKNITKKLAELDDREIGVKNKGGGGFIGKYGAIIEGAAFAGNAIANMAGNYNKMYATQDITQMNNRAQFAAEGNRQYFLAERAVMGEDVDAAFELATSPQFEKEFAKMAKNTANTTGVIGAVGRSIGNIGGGGMKGAAIGLAAGIALAPFTGGASIPIATKIGAGIGMASGASDSAAEFTDIGYGNVGAEASFRAIQSVRKLNEQERKIKTYEIQKFYSQGMNTYRKGAGIADAGGMQEALMDNETLLNLANAGVSATRATNLLPILKNAGEFGGAGAGIGMIESAGRAQQKGIMSREDYISSAARLVAAGGDNDDLQDIITKGMENAKNINQMVEASIQMSAGLSNLGVSGIDSTQNMLSASVQDYMNLGVNKNLATGAALSNMQALSGAMQSKGMTFGNMMERAGLRRIKGLEGASVFQMNRLSEMSLEQVATLRGGGKEAKNLARELGIDNLVLDKQGNIKAGMMDQIADQALKGAITDTGGVQYYRSMIKKARSGEAFTPEERAVAKQLGSNEIAMRRLYSSEADTTYGKGSQMNGSKTEITQAKKEASQIAGGAKFAEEFFKSDAFTGIEKMMESIGEVSGKEFHKNVVQAAKDFEGPVVKFGENVGLMEKILNKHAENLRLMDENRAPTTSSVNQDPKSNEK